MQNSREYFFSVIAIAVVAVDQATKYVAYAGKLGSFLHFFSPVFQQLLTRNYNFAFSIPLPHVLAYVVYAIVVFAFCSWYFTAQKTSSESVGFYLVIGGALSNIIDRIALGYVRDFILGFWGNIFNVADVAIVAGIILILIVNIRKPAISRS
jgi:signal peptidase II